MLASSLCADVETAAPSAKSAFSLPPSRVQPSFADNRLPVPVARWRDEGRSTTTKPRIWSLAEVATSDDYRPKRTETETDQPLRVSAAEFRPWTDAETGTWERAAAARLGSWPVADLTATGTDPSVEPSSRWHQNNADKCVTTPVID